MTYSVFMTPEGLMNTSATLMQDEASSNLCFNLPSYKKCVTYGVNKPEKLDELVSRIFTDANTLSAQDDIRQN